MAKHNSERKVTMGGFISTPLSTLGTRKVLTAKISTLIDSGTLISARGVTTLLTPDDDDGPFIFGCQTGGLSATDIEAAFEAQGPTSRQHDADKEVASRWRHIRVLGVLMVNHGANATHSYVLAFDKVVKMGFTEADAGWEYFVYNLGAT